MNAATLTEWFAEHHPEVTPDPERWAHTLPAHEPHELAAALDEWDAAAAPRPAEIGALIRDARAVCESVDERAKADAALAELRRQWPRRTPEDRARARMIDASRERRPVPPLAPRKAS